MTPTVTASVGGTAPLAYVQVTPLVAADLPARGFQVDFIQGTTVVSSTGYRLGTGGLISIAGSPTFARAAVRDSGGHWSDFVSVSFSGVSNFSAGSIEGSIGSAAQSDYSIQSPGIEFPDLSMGSGVMQIRKTYVAQTQQWIDEVRAPQWQRGRAAFHCVLKDLDIWQAEMVSRLWRATLGPQRPFFFDFVDPQLGNRTTAGATRHLVRFRDSSLGRQLTDATLTDMDFTLVEVLDDTSGK